MKSRELILIGAIILIICVFIRLPYFFPAVLDWDESTYILMGQSVLNGHLPYVELWDNKPPFIFYLVASFIFLFGKSIIAVRIGGAICVAVSAFFLYLIARKFMKILPSLITAILYISATSLIISGQSTQSEHLALAFLIPGIYLYFTRIKIFFRYLLIGLLIACASFIRTNLGIVCAAFGIYIFVYYLSKKGLGDWIKAISGYACGVIFIIILAIFPYIISHRFDIWWHSVIKVPLVYIASQYTVLEALGLHGRFIINNIIHPKLLNTISVLVIVTGVVGIIAFFLTWERYDAIMKRNWLFLCAIFLNIYISIIVGGAFWPEYLIQIIPFLSLSTVFIVSLIQNKHIQGGIISLLMILLIIASKNVLFEYRRMISRFVEQGKVTYGPAYEIKSYLEKNKIQPGKTFLMTQHIVYWLMNSEPLAREVTHPSNIHLSYLLDEISYPKTTPFQLMQRILDGGPEVIVVTDNPFYYVDPKADSLLTRTLNDKYYLARTIKESLQQTLIYRKHP